jgi:hypothetical protein
MIGRLTGEKIGLSSFDTFVISKKLETDFLFNFFFNFYIDFKPKNSS